MISACMIVKNEQDCLDKCLRSIQGVDEIVILDTGSKDKTGDIARRYTDKYYPDEYVWNDNFAEARNYAAKKCTGDWILIIDADETLEEEGIEKIRKAVKQTKKNSIQFKTIAIRVTKVQEHRFITIITKVQEPRLIITEVTP